MTQHESLTATIGIEKPIREHLLDTLNIWFAHKRIGAETVSDEILVALIQQSVLIDREQMTKLRERLAAETLTVKELQIQLKKCREAGHIHALPAEDNLAAAAA